jgi:hypothetical protein
VGVPEVEVLVLEVLLLPEVVEALVPEVVVPPEVVVLVPEEEVLLPEVEVVVPELLPEVLVPEVVLLVPEEEVLVPEVPEVPEVEALVPGGVVPPEVPPPPPSPKPPRTDDRGSVSPADAEVNPQAVLTTLGMVRKGGNRVSDCMNESTDCTASTPGAEREWRIASSSRVKDTERVRHSARGPAAQRSMWAGERLHCEHGIVVPERLG